MKLPLLTLFALALWAAPSWAARKNPESLIEGFSSPQSPAQKVQAHLGKRRKQPPSEFILGKGVAEGECKGRLREGLWKGVGVQTKAGERWSGWGDGYANYHKIVTISN